MSNSSALSANRPYSFPEIASHIGMDTKKLRRWLLRAHVNQPGVEAVIKVPGGGWIVPSIAKLQEYEGWGEVAKRFVKSEDADALQARIKDQDRQLQALRARLSAEERLGKARDLLAAQQGKIIERLAVIVLGDDFGEENESGVFETALGRASRTATR